jgi:hypothetical protein
MGKEKGYCAQWAGLCGWLQPGPDIGSATPGVVAQQRRETGEGLQAYDGGGGGRIPVVAGD